MLQGSSVPVLENERVSLLSSGQPGFKNGNRSIAQRDFSAWLAFGFVFDRKNTGNKIDIVPFKTQKLT